jgi:large subunit ribosomal protein L24
MRIKKGDIVKIISGNFRGNKGKVLSVFPDKSTAIIEGINFQKKHLRPKSAQEPGGIIQKEGPIHCSNLLLICPKCGEVTKIGFKLLDNRKVRICKKCGEMIDE